MGQIYIITNNKNGKIYVGKSSRPSDKYFGSGAVLRRAIKKYGREGFLKRILEDNIPNFQLNAREQFWISYLCSNNRAIGYNLTDGGDGGDTLSNHPRKQEIYKGRDLKSFWTVQQREIRRRKSLGSLNPFSHHRHSRATRRKISLAKRGSHLSDTTKHKISKSLKRQYDAGIRVTVISERQRRMASKRMTQHPPTQRPEVREKLRIAFSGARNPASKTWVFKADTGQEIQTTGNFKKQCEILGLCYSSMRKIAYGLKKIKKHRGWTVFAIDIQPILI